MSIICEEIAHQAGFIVSVGNWITPDGSLIIGKDYESHHWSTIKEYLKIEPKTDNHLRWMNEKVAEGYIRLVFRAYVFFQICCEKKEEIWEDNPNIKTMRVIMRKIPEHEIHIFSKNFYIIGISQNILDKNNDKLQIHVK